jgi:hypothetical protein
VNGKCWDGNRKLFLISVIAKTWWAKITVATVNYDGRSFSVNKVAEMAPVWAEGTLLTWPNVYPLSWDANPKENIRN